MACLYYVLNGPTFGDVYHITLHSPSTVYSKGFQKMNAVVLKSLKIRDGFVVYTGVPTVNERNFHR